MKLVLILTLLCAVSAQPFNCLPDPVGSCSGHGVCVNNATFGFYCECKNNWDNQGCPPEVQCCNELLSRTPVFLAAFFGGFTGAPYFLIGENGLGAGILVLSLIGLFLDCIGFYTQSPLLRVVGAALGFMSFLWHTSLWIMVAASTNEFDTTKVAPW